MANPRTVMIPSFVNPVLQSPGGTEFTTPQVVNIEPGQLTAIAIAADSPIDVCDVYPEGQIDPNKRIRVSAKRPWVGDLGDAGKLVVVPVRAFDKALTVPTWTGMSTSPGILTPTPAAPIIKLDLYKGCVPVLPQRRAPYVEHMNNTGAGVAAGSIAVATTGRRRVSWSFQLGNYAGAATVTVTITGRDYSVKADGTVVEIETVLFTSAALAAGDVAYEYEGTPFDAMRVILTPNAGTFDFSATVSAEDD